jgi:cobalt/nickel transport system permease protein
VADLHVHALDVYSPRESIVHRLDPRVKLVLTAGFIISAALVPEGGWSAYGALAVLAVLVAFISRLGIGFVQRRATVVLPFTLAAVAVVFSTPGCSVLTVSVLGQELNVTNSGLTRFASVLLKSWLSVQMAVVLTASTRFPDVLRAMRDVGLPKVMVSVAGFAYRYIFVIGDEVLRMMRARTARSGSLEESGGGSVFWRAQVTGGMAGSLFLRSIERSERVYDAMVARGYNGEVRSLHPPALDLRDVLIALPFALLLVAIPVAARISW